MTSAKDAKVRERTAAFEEMNTSIGAGGASRGLDCRERPRRAERDGLDNGGKRATRKAWCYRTRIIVPRVSWPGRGMYNSLSLKGILLPTPSFSASLANSTPPSITPFHFSTTATSTTSPSPNSAATVRATAPILRASTMLQANEVASLEMPYLHVIMGGGFK